MIAVLSKSDNVAVAAPSGWTLVDGRNIKTSATLTWGGVFYRVADGTETTVTFTKTAVNTVVDIVAFSGVDTTGGYLVGGGAGGPFDAIPGTILVGGSTQAAVAATAISTNTPGAGVLMCATCGGSGAATLSGWSTSVPGALTELSDHANGNGAIGTAFALKGAVGSTGAGSATLSVNKPPRRYSTCVEADLKRRRDYHSFGWTEWKYQSKHAPDCTCWRHHDIHNDPRCGLCRF